MHNVIVISKGPNRIIKLLDQIINTELNPKVNYEFFKAVDTKYLQSIK